MCYYTHSAVVWLFWAGEGWGCLLFGHKTHICPWLARNSLYTSDSPCLASFSQIHFSSTLFTSSAKPIWQTGALTRPLPPWTKPLSHSNSSATCKFRLMWKQGRDTCKSLVRVLLSVQYQYKEMYNKAGLLGQEMKFFAPPHQHLFKNWKDGRRLTGPSNRHGIIPSHKSYSASWHKALATWKINMVWLCLVLSTCLSLMHPDEPIAALIMTNLSAALAVFKHSPRPFHWHRKKEKISFFRIHNHVIWK